MWSGNLVGYSATAGMFGGDLYVYTLGGNYDYIIVATAVYTLILGVFIVIYVIDNTSRIFELLFLGCGAILNIVAGIIQLIYDIDNSGNWAAFLLSIGMIVIGVLLAVNFFIEFRK